MPDDLTHGGTFMGFKMTERDLQDEAHATNPQPGDYWHEMLSPVLVVLGVAAGMVIVCDKAKNTDANHWTWDLSQRKAMTLAEFKAKLHYKSCPGYWCSVEPECHKFVLKHLEETSCPT